jgi:hypothetical protein
VVKIQRLLAAVLDREQSAVNSLNSTLRTALLTTIDYNNIDESYQVQKAFSRERVVDSPLF